MIRTLIMFARLHSLRRSAPEMFDGAAAAATIAACILEYDRLFCAEIGVTTSDDAGVW